MVKDSITIKYRKPRGAGLKQENVKGLTEGIVKQCGCLQYLKTHVMNVLRRSWGPGVLQLENILLFQESADETTVWKITDDRHIDWKQPGDKKFVAMEYFTTVPTALFRTVKNDELAYLTFSHPVHVEDSTWTKMSPFHCAAFKKKKGLDFETSLPWFGMDTNSKEKKFVVHGVSLFCYDNAEKEVENSFDPFTEPDPEEEKGVRSMSLGNAFGIPVEEDGLEGILFSRHTHDMTKEMQDAKSHMYTYDNSKERKSSKLVTQRETYLRFKLKEGIDLAPYGVAVVYDNNSKLHFSLVLSGEQWDPLAKWTAAGDSLELHLPNDTWTLYNTIKRDEETRRNQFLLNHVLKTGNHEPENCVLARRDYRYIPKVAALFQLHDLKLVAKAEPRELLPDDKHYQIYQAVMVLFHSDLEWDVYLAIEALENANYFLERITPSERDTLQEAIAEVGKDFESAMDSLEWDYARVDDAIDAMDEQLRALQDKIYSERHPTPLRGNFERESSSKQKKKDSSSSERQPTPLRDHFERESSSKKKKEGTPESKDSSVSQGTGETPLAASPQRKIGPKDLANHFQESLGLGGGEGTITKEKSYGA